ncbi:MAG TPA: class I SAM-dependent methyltransferase [Anaeromyxobacteraceae bacterium]|nr:class I SAM-dependent methyltransferase [Anaeromyxobacteraceae bacterium]
MRAALTTVASPGAGALAGAALAASRHGLPLVAREGRPLAQLSREAGVEALVVLGTHALLWVEGEEHRFSPGMGALRAKRVALGDRTTRDPFLEAAGLRPGDSVLDCTAGLGADALVAATAVGPGGRVLGLESSRALAAWTDEGFRRLAHPAARRVEIRSAEHGAFLAACAERSFDVVVFDPMFRHARSAEPAFAPVRRLANPCPLEAGALARARLVARRCVVVKDGTPGWDLARLGLAPLPSRRGAHRLYARLEAAR